MNLSKNLLKIKNLNIKRGSLTVAQNIDLELQSGKVYALLGANGAGKSSLIKGIFGELHYSGEIIFEYLNNQNSQNNQNNIENKILSRKNVVAWRKNIGYMPQDTHVEAALTALEVVLLGRMDALNMHLGDEILTQAAEIMADLQIADLAHRPIAGLSGGQRQLVMFAQVLLKNPKILLLDEPVSALDMRHQLNLLEQVCRHTQDKNLITLMILHDLSLAAQFADDVILLGDGKIQAAGSPNTVFQKEILEKLYQIDVEILSCERGLPVVRPKRKF